MIRYALVQLPAAMLLAAALYALVQWQAIPGWLAWTLLGLWLAKDAALYPFLRKAYEPDTHIPGQSLLGKLGIAREHLDPTGYVEVQGELWRAESRDGKPIPKGHEVKVGGIEGLTLKVEEIPTPNRKFA